MGKSRLLCFIIVKAHLKSISAKPSIMPFKMAKTQINISNERLKIISSAKN
jgi:hypothetical protein